jgi:hypothetical protein
VIPTGWPACARPVLTSGRQRGGWAHVDGLLVVDVDGLLVVDVDGTLVDAHSD